MHGASWQVLSRGESLPCWRMSVIDTEKMYFCRGEGFSLLVECLLEQFILRCVPSSASASDSPACSKSTSSRVSSIASRAPLQEAAASWISFICGPIRHIISSLLLPSGETFVQTRTETEVEQPQVDEVQ